MTDRGEPRAPFLKMALVLWTLGVVGAALVLPYAMTLQDISFPAEAARLGTVPWVLIAVSIAQSAILLAIAVFVGLWAARKLGLGAPLLNAALKVSPPPQRWGRTFVFAALIGIGVGAILLGLEHYLFAPAIPALSNAASHPPVWQGLLASFYGAINEELLMRLGLLSVLALVFRTIVRAFGAVRQVPLTSGVFWAANIVTAVIFGLGHLPITAAVVPLSAIVITRALVLNGIAGVVYGELYRRYGLEWAITAHFTTDIVLHVLFPLSA